MPDARDDDDLLAALRAATRARSQVPPEFVQAGQDAYARRTVDAELAALTFDSGRAPEAAGTRSDSASIRALTFTSAGVTIEVEVTENALIGQVIPPWGGTVEAQTRDGTATAAPVDGIGCFSVEPVPPGPFRLRYRSQQAADVVTSWITL
jgi:hypothetical protein